METQSIEAIKDQRHMSTYLEQINRRATIHKMRMLLLDDIVYCKNHGLMFFIRSPSSIASGDSLPISRMGTSIKILNAMDERDKAVALHCMITAGLWELDYEEYSIIRSLYGYNFKSSFEELSVDRKKTVRSLKRKHDEACLNLAIILRIEILKDANG